MFVFQFHITKRYFLSIFIYIFKTFTIYYPFLIWQYSRFFFISAILINLSLHLYSHKKLNSITISLTQTIATSLKFIAFCFKSWQPSHQFSHHFRLESKIYFNKVPVMTNNMLMQTIGFININSFIHINPIIF